MPSVLRKLVLDKAELFSIVDKGASGDDDHRPRIVLIKRRKDTPMPLDAEKLTQSITEAVAKLLKEDEGEKAKPAFDEETAEAVAAAVKAALKATEPEPMTLEKSMEGLDAETQVKIAIAVAKEGLADMKPGQLLEAALSGVDEATRAAVMAAVGALHRSAPPMEEPAKPAPSVEIEDEAKMEEGQEPKAPPLPEDKDKMEDEAMKSQDVEKQELKARIEKLEKSHADAVEKLAKADAEKQLAEQVSVAKKFPNVAGDVEKRGAALLALKKADEKAYDVMVETLKSANEMCGHALKEKGSAVHGSDSDAGRFEGLVKAHAKEEKVSYQKAFAEVAKANPGLYERAKSEGM
jgi:hypothetical protein